MERFGIVSAQLMTDLTLSIEAKALYAILTTYCNKDRSCYPTTKKLMEITGKSRATIYRYLRELENKNVIKKIDQQGRRIILLIDRIADC